MLFMGASIGKEDIAFYEPKFPQNDIMRIFPEDKSITDNGGTTKTVKVICAWDDPRMLYCKRKRTIPFVSPKVDGWAAGIAYVKNQLLQLPDWILNDNAMYLYITDRHEPEGDLGSGTAGQDAYKANFTAFMAMINTLPANIRAKVKCGPILTKTWTEDSGSGKGQFDYSKYDPGIGDWFGVDMYVPTGTSSAVVSPSTLPTPAAFVATFKAYKFSAGDTRPRIWPELGLIGMPADTDGSARANWIQGVYDQVKLMKVGAPGWTMPWSFVGFLWWNQEGKATGTVATVGQRRDFPLDERTTSTTTAVKLVPPLPMDKFNALLAAERAIDPWPPATGTPDPDPDPTPVDPYPNTGVEGRYLVGATMQKDDIPVYKGLLSGNQMFRIFPNSDGLPPAWTDPRFVYAQEAHAIPFVSSNIDGDAGKFAALVTWLNNMPGWVPYVYITDRHEPENNYPNNPAQYLTNYTAWWNNVILQLPAAIRARVKAGPVVTRQWITGGPTKGNNNYQQYDPGPSISDFYGIDMYMDSWLPGNTTAVATSYVNPVTFLAGVKAYRYNNTTDTRPRIFAELGAIGIPADPTGAARAAWITGRFVELDSWSEAAQGGKFAGAAWWNNIGTGGSSLTPIGTARYFYLDRYQASDGTLKPYAGTPTAPLTALNHAITAHAATTPPDGDPGTGGGTGSGDPSDDGGTNPIPGVPINTGGFPVDSPAAARLLAATYTILITDKNLVVQGDPIHEWSYLQATLRWKDPGSGQFKVPNFPYIRQQIQPVLRTVLGITSVLISGPIEQRLRERADNGENGGYGQMTVTFADDLASIAARIAYPNPALTLEAQTTDWWTYSGNPELGMLQLVDTQAGMGALAARRVPKLQVAAFSGIAGTGTVALGPTTDVNPRNRLEPLADVLRTMATNGVGTADTVGPLDPDSLGFRTRQTQATDGADIILFEVVRSRRMEGQVHFSFGRGNLKYYSFQEDAPTLTHLAVGGQYNADDASAGADKFVKEFVTGDANTLDWGRHEGYMARPGSDVSANKPDVLADITNEFKDKIASGRLAISAADTVDCRAGVHYGPGDIVSAELDIGEYVIAPVQTISIQAYPTAGEVVGTTIGDQSARYESAWVRAQRALDLRVGVLERRGSARPA